MKKNNYSIINLIFTTFSLCKEAIKYWKIPAIYSIFLVFTAIAFSRWTYSCNSDEMEFWCYNMPNNKYIVYSSILIYSIIYLYLLFSSTYDLYNSMFKNSVFKTKNILKNTKEKIKSSMFLTIFFILLLIPMIIAFKILIKKPNPIWQIEFIYFTIMFIMFFAPLITIRLSSSVAYYFDTLKFPKFIEIFKHTSGKAYVAIFTFLFLILIINIFYMKIMGYMLPFTNSNKSFFISFTAEYIDAFYKIISIFVIFLYFCAQKQILDNLSEDNAPSNEVEDIAENIDNDDLRLSKKGKSKKKRKYKNK